MTTELLLELFAGFAAALIALWMIVLNRQPARAGGPTRTASSLQVPAFVRQGLSHYFLREGRLANIGLLLLRLSIGAMMIHHGQDKLGDPQAFANTYVAPLHLPFPLFFAYVAGYSEILGSWLLILGLLSPLGALALTGTMSVAAYHHILTAGLNIYVLELVVLYLGGSLALLLVGPGRYSFDAAMLSEWLADPAQGEDYAGSDADQAYGSSSSAIFEIATEATN